MSSSSASNRVQALLDALDGRDGSALASMLADDAVYDNGRGERLVGREAIRDALVERAAALDERHADRLLMASEDGRRVAVEVTLRGTYGRTIAGLPAANGQRYSIEACLVFALDGAEIERVTRYLDMAALERALRQG